MKLLVESHTRVEITFVAAVEPVLQARAPTGNVSGPTVTLLESRPSTFQVIGTIVSAGVATAAVGRVAISRLASRMAAPVAIRRRELRPNGLGRGDLPDRAGAKRATPCSFRWA